MYLHLHHPQPALVLQGELERPRGGGALGVGGVVRVRWPFATEVLGLRCWRRAVSASMLMMMMRMRIMLDDNGDFVVGQILHGFLSDTFPINGERRRPYVFLGFALCRWAQACAHAPSAWLPCLAQVDTIVVAPYQPVPHAYYPEGLSGSSGPLLAA
jgi:hypothetical protein